MTVFGSGIHSGSRREEWVSYGGALARLARHDEARAAWRLVLERDPESGAVALANAKFAAMP